MLSRRKIRRPAGERAFNAANLLCMALLSAITLYPMLYVIFGSFSDPVRLASADGLLLRPAGFSFKGYRAVFLTGNIWLGYRNTLVYVCVGTAFSMLLTILGAYALSKSGYMLKKAVLTCILVTMFFSGGMVPSYLVVKRLALVNTLWAFIIPSALSTYNMIVLRTAFQGIPASLFDSAAIDGATETTVLTRIVLPLSLPALATITLFYAVGIWGSWYNALVYLQGRRDLYPLQMFLRELLVTEDFTDAGYNASIQAMGAESYLLKEVVKYAAIVVATLPILFVYPFLQRYFVKGVMLGSIKE